MEFKNYTFFLLENFLFKIVITDKLLHFFIHKNNSLKTNKKYFFLIYTSQKFSHILINKLNNKFVV